MCIIEKFRGGKIIKNHHVGFIAQFASKPRWEIQLDTQSYSSPPGLWLALVIKPPLVFQKDHKRCQQNENN